MIEKSLNPQSREAEFVAFRAGSLEFCINIMSVREIRGWTPATAIPRAPSYIRGVIKPNICFSWCWRRRFLIDPSGSWNSTLA